MQTRQRIQRHHPLARQRIEIAKRLQAAIAALAGPLDELAEVSGELGGIIEDGGEAESVGRWRGPVRDALAALMSERGIDDLGLAMDWAPLADALAIGAAA